MSDRKVQSRVGDVFQIPISGGECGFGQILAKYKGEMLLMVIFAFRDKCSDDPRLADIVASKPLFIGNSLDAKIWHGHWPVIGNVAVDLTRVPLPNYKVRIGGSMCIENYYADRARPATDSELARLMFRKCVAPIRLENAIKAYYGACEWEESFESLKAEAALQAAHIDV